jgi:hypothetical protein
MPLLDGKPKPSTLLVPSAQSQESVDVNPIAIESSQALSTITDTRWISRSDLGSFTEGATWELSHYFAQVLNTDSQLSGQQLSRDATYQSYRCIKDLPIKVSSVLSETQDEQTKAMQITGSATIAQGIIPNEGDMFAADIGEARVGIFKVISSNRKSHFKSSVYEISYILITDASANLSDLLQKSILTLIYQKDLQRYGLDPLILPSVAAYKSTLEKIFAPTLDFYLRQFVSQEFKALMVPGQIASTYEIFLTGYLLKAFSYRDHGLIGKLHYTTHGGVQEYTSVSIWDAILARDVNVLGDGFKKIATIGNDYFSKDPLQSSIRYSGMHRCVYPKDPVMRIDKYGAEWLGLAVCTDLDIPDLVEGDVNDLLAESNTQVLSTPDRVPLNRACLNGSYVLSEDFYNLTPESTFEDIVLKYIRQQSIDIAVILDAAKAMRHWGVLERFYYGPIVLTLMKATIYGAL